MPKLKTRKAAAKRFRITRTGKIMRRCANMRHLLEGKSKKQKTTARRVGRVAKADEARVRLMLAGAR